MSGNIIKVAVADDQTLFRSGVKASLSAHKDIHLVAEAENGIQLLNLLKHIQPDIVILDITMPVMDGLATLPEIKRLYPGVRVIILSMHNDHSMINRMMELGANSYITKESGAEKIYEAIKQVHENEFFYNDLTNKALLSGLRNKNRLDAGKPDELHLNEKELIIFRLLCNEKSTKEIADIVALSPRKVEAIRDKLKTKTGTKSMTDLVMYGIKEGIIDNEIKQAAASISKEQITSLFKISNSILSYVNHDLAGQRATLYNSLDEIKEELQKNGSEIFDLQYIYNHLERAFEAVAAVSSINKLIKSYVNLSRSDNFTNLFIAWPNEIVETIRERNTNAEIKILSSNITLQIIYPRVILSSILTELVENAKKNTKEDLQISIKWSMKGKHFQCEVHDNGPGIEGLKEKQFTPMNFLKVDYFGMGLKIIDRTMIDSGGHLFFSKSEHLKGLKVSFDFPVIDFTARNTQL